MSEENKISDEVLERMSEKLKHYESPFHATHDKKTADKMAKEVDDSMDTGKQLIINIKRIIDSHGFSLSPIDVVWRMASDFHPCYRAEVESYLVKVLHGNAEPVEDFVDSIIEAQIPDTETQVIADIKARQQLGIEKYGTTLADNPLPLREWLQHAYEEQLDNCVYLKRAMQELDK